MTRLLVPKGRLWDDSLELIRRLGIPIDSDTRSLHFASPTEDLEVLVLKVQDIPQILHRGAADFAVASDEWIDEIHEPSMRSVVPLCWYHAELCMLTHRDAATVSRLPPRSIATSFPRSAQMHFSRGHEDESDGRVGDPQIWSVGGSVEAYPGRLTRWAVDCVETGETAAQNGLIVTRSLRSCDVRLVCSPTAVLDRPEGRLIVAAATSMSRNQNCSFSDLFPAAGIAHAE